MVQSGMMSIEKTLKLLTYFHKNQGRAIDSYDEELQSSLEVDQRQLSRILEVAERELENIISVKKGRRKAYKLIEPMEVLKEAYANDISLSMLFEMAKEGMPELIEEWEGVNRKESKPYSFFNMPYEDIKNLEDSPVFKSLKNAIERREYRNIHLHGGKSFPNVKPIRLIFSEGNWYVAYVDEEELRVSRISFIREVRYSKIVQNYKPSTVSKYLIWLEESFQNPFSRYGVPAQTAVLKAAPNIAHYFDKGMKRFFKSQRFVRKEEDGSVVFSVEYTQPMEVLPFVRRWLPDLSILEPKELKKVHIKILQDAL